MDGREFKDEMFGHFARVGAAFGHAKRLEIVDVLAQGERSVESLATQVNASVGATSRHLQVLAQAGLVVRRVQGTSRVYRLADPAVLAGYRALVALAESRLVEVTALAEAPVAEHVAVFERAHEQLRRALDARPDASGDPRAD